MANLDQTIIILAYVCQSVALFSGGLFAGAAVYISLTECPPRTSLTLDGLLALYRSIARRTNALLAALAAVTSVAAAFASIMGAGMWWLAGAVVHGVLAAYLLTEVRGIATELEHLDAGPEFRARGKSLMHRRSLQFGMLGLGGLLAQYLFLMGR